MTTNTYFGSVPNNRDRVIALVRREAAEECCDDQLPPPILDDCVREAVDRLRDSRLTTFVPLLALRRVRACLRAGTCDGDEW